MIGQVIVMEPTAYQAWLSSGGGATGTLASNGQQLFQQLGCATCHRSDTQGRGPNLAGLFGKQVLLEDGRTVVADENYIRESILNPGAKIVSGFKPIMPSYQGQVSEESLMALVAYIKSLSQPQRVERQATGIRCSRAVERAIRLRTLKVCDMATAVQTVERENYLNSNYGIKSWLLTTDHKRIAMLYLISITAMFWIGGFFAMMIRLELLTPAGDLVSSDTYNKLFTMHGIIMVFFFLIPSVPAVIGNFVIPLMVGAKDLAFPRINLLSWYIYMVGAITALVAMVTGGVDTGWTFYTPFSTTYSNTHVIGAADRHLHRRLLVHLYRTEFHRHHSPHARARHDLAPPAAVLLVELRGRAHHGAGHAGHRDHACCWLRWSALSTSASSIRNWAAIRCCSSICSGSTRTRLSTS